jgi:hypothetical protein
LKLQSLKVPLPKTDPPAKPAVTAARPFGPPVKTGTGAKSIAGSSSTGLAPAVKTRPAPLADDKRRSQRVMLRVRANIHVALHGKQSTYEVTTLSVNHHGAIVVVERNLPVDTPLVLEHGQTKEKVPCKVARAAREMPEGYHVPIEFDTPAPDFWKIAFPPSDWRSQD